MEQFNINNLTLRISDNINYVWILLPQQVSREEFATMLGNAEFHSLLDQHNVKNVLVDCSNMWSFGIPEMSDFLDTDFTSHMGKIGVQKISVIVNETVLSMMSFIFQTIEQNHTEVSPQIRFFDSSKFHESFESVSWF